MVWVSVRTGVWGGGSVLMSLGPLGREMDWKEGSQCGTETRGSSIYQRRRFGMETHHKSNRRRRTVHLTLGGI